MDVKGKVLPYSLSKNRKTKINAQYSEFPAGSDSKESACNVEDLSWIPGLGRSPGEGNGYPFQYSCMENSMDRGAW